MPTMAVRNRIWKKKSNAYLDDFTRNAGSKNYTKFARDVNNWGQPGCQGQPWCAVYQFWKLVKIFGLARALQIMGGGFYNCRSVTQHAKQKEPGIVRRRRVRWSCSEMGHILDPLRI